MKVSDWINVALTTLSFILAIISVVTVILTLRQNKKMIESSSRPYIVVYGDMTNFSDLQFYIILKNFGKSGAIIKNLTCDKDLSKFNYGTDLTPFESIKNTMLAPNQNFICSIDHLALKQNNINTLNVSIEYEFCGKTYNENYTVNYGAFRKNLTAAISNRGKELEIISYTLQEMVQKDL